MKSNRSSNSRRWLTRHIQDEYVQHAQRDGYRSRAAYKLLEIHKKYNLLQQSYLVVDLGAAPGSWCQIAANLVGSNGKVIGLDLLPITPIPGVITIQSDFSTNDSLGQLGYTLERKLIDVVLSDMAPNLTGIKTVDQSSTIYLCELALDFCQYNLKQNGTLVIKIFHGAGFDDYLRNIRRMFRHVICYKPKASRSESKEVYLVAQGFKKNNNLL
ncbi:23S rRNA methyltransferase [Achromatium sp. WMS1]|nr:23S rRNA methyltransferase [Achromatium sp. WMS1]